MSHVTGRPYFVYILWSESAQRFYIGISENPRYCLEQHNQGVSSWTAWYPPWGLVQVERYEITGRHEAVKFS